MNAQVRDREGSITAFEIDGVRIEYCITYAVGSRPHRANVKLAGQKNKVDWLESIIESEKDIFGKK
ncbi:MAG: hypothetical protein HY438_04355 [DPANN group archaeon]|nr:hypothetical protein [DPANN group archaeon]